ncbi:hypothetical protein SAMN06297387_110124 [Streptomyces zhaozhouensis]|uniref:Uncharacterized protein n=1 Tax=Streptomyces zhaozhouensis TaxID=1300267 RepID=A0A286DXK5_9ACTN|nr:hypothetical protein [Streptomyces zhaozhouensis]SOD63392.1 hypothetical protein SAMN06297387_110124 [Streptomyces zhaozhouensis]
MSQPPPPPGAPGQPNGPGYGYPHAATQPDFRPTAPPAGGPPQPPPGGPAGPPQAAPPPAAAGPGPGGPGYGYPQQPPPGPAGQGPGYGYPQGPGPAPGMPAPFPPPPPPGAGGNVGAALGLTLAAMLGMFLLYGFLTGMVVDFEDLMKEAMENGDTEIDVAQLTWLAPLVGGVIGLPAALMARGKVALYWLAAGAAVVAMLLGETFATAVLISDASDGAKSAFEIFFEDFSDVWEGWTENSHGMVWPLMALAPATALFAGYFLGGTGSPKHPVPHPPQPMPYR